MAAIARENNAIRDDNDLNTNSVIEEGVSSQTHLLQSEENNEDNEIIETTNSFVTLARKNAMRKRALR